MASVIGQTVEIMGDAIVLSFHQKDAIVSRFALTPKDAARLAREIFHQIEKYLQKKLDAGR